MAANAMVWCKRRNTVLLLQSRYGLEGRKWNWSLTSEARICLRNVTVLGKLSPKLLMLWLHIRNSASVDKLVNQLHLSPSKHDEAWVAFVIFRLVEVTDSTVFDACRPALNCHWYLRSANWTQLCYHNKKELRHRYFCGFPAPTCAPHASPSANSSEWPWLNACSWSHCFIAAGLYYFLISASVPSHLGLITKCSARNENVYFPYG